MFIDVYSLTMKCCLNQGSYNTGDVFKALSHEATKISMMYSKPPVPSNEVS